MNAETALGTSSVCNNAGANGDPATGVNTPVWSFRVITAPAVEKTNGC
ncbi:MAG TPA: hypothetical protein VIW93_02315 [Candidatus Acidoferrum sp.]